MRESHRPFGRWLTCYTYTGRIMALALSQTPSPFFVLLIPTVVGGLSNPQELLQAQFFNGLYVSIPA